MSEELEGWDTGHGWHERENMWYIVVREFKLCRMLDDLVVFEKNGVAQQDFRVGMYGKHVLLDQDE